MTLVTDPAEIARLNEALVWHKLPGRDSGRFGIVLEAVECGDDFLFLEDGQELGWRSAAELVLLVAQGQSLRFGARGQATFVTAKCLRGFVDRLELRARLPVSVGARQRLSPLAS